MKPYLVFLLNLSSCAYIHEDSVIEELAEEVIKAETGLSVDLTPSTEEK